MGVWCQLFPFRGCCPEGERRERNEAKSVFPCFHLLLGVDSVIFSIPRAFKPISDNPGDKDRRV